MLSKLSVRHLTTSNLLPTFNIEVRHSNHLFEIWRIWLQRKLAEAELMTMSMLEEMTALERIKHLEG